MKERLFYFSLFLLSVFAYLFNLSSYPLLSSLVSFINRLLMPVMEFKAQTKKRVQDLVNTYVFLVDTQKRNKELLEEVNALSLKVSELEGCKRELLQLKGLMEEPPTVEYTLAGVVAYDPSGRDEFMLLDKGMRDGLEEGFVVAYRNVFLGIVDQVYADTSRVRTVWSDNLHVSANAGGKNYIYRGGFPKGSLLHVPQEDELKKGEKVFLRSLGLPPLEIGEVYEVYPLGEQFFKRVEVKPYGDVRRVDFVLVLRRRL
jgi:rod shape-determining protein MreC